MESGSPWQDTGTEPFIHFATMYFVASIVPEHGIDHAPALGTETASQPLPPISSSSAPASGTPENEPPAGPVAPVLPASSGFPADSNSTTSMLAPINIGLTAAGQVETSTTAGRLASEPATAASGGASLASEVSSAAVVRPSAASTRQIGPAVVVSDSTTINSSRSTPVPGNATTAANPDRVAVAGPLPLLADHRTVESPSSTFPTFLVSTVGFDDSLRRPDNEFAWVALRPTGSEALANRRTTDQDDSALAESVPDLAYAPLPAPERAGLFDGELPFGLAALENAVRALLGSDSSNRSDASFLLRGVVVGTWMMGATLAWTVARRKSRQLDADLCDTYGLGQFVPVEDELR
jgi:hypothetical protein